ncbi:unnamed protein product [Mytilus edulis]|uniref:Uncharacterized protein n=1 Tax=Mytilus edulis TaxID=6550 RepID=A0A8S3UTJ8_MYTED|nr:unnamed protein product [Mytilus edulis]
MTLELFIALLLIAGIISGKTPCKTWELHRNNISLICRIKNKVEPVTFIHSKWNLKDKCTLNNTRKCEIFQINEDTISYTYENEVVLVINDYERKCVINDEWTCSEGNSTLKSVVSTSKGILSDTILKLSLLNSPTLQRVTLICYSSRTPHGYHVEFLKNGKSVDSITFNMVSRKCTHIGGECLPDKCSCSPFGNNFTRIFPYIAGNNTTTFSCSMKFVDNDTSSKLLKIATVLFDNQGMNFNHTKCS